MRAFLLIATPLLLAFAPSTAGADDYLGAERCAACHAEAYAWWKTTAHARASEVLSAAEQRDPRCTSCHATAADQGHLGVQCESCHGAGRHYWPAFVMVDLGLARAAGLRKGDEPATCKGCHSADTTRIKPFDLKAAIEAMRSHAPPTGGTP